MVQPSQANDQLQDKPRLKRIEAIIAGIVGLVILVVLLCAASYQLIFSLNLGVVPGKARIMNKRVISDDDGAASYTLDYAFEASGHTVRHSASCSPDSYKLLREGDTINIDYFSPWPQAASKLDFKMLDPKKD